MGITGLLPFLKKASRTANIKEFQGCTVAIDTYCWLHKGAFSCAEKLALGEKTDQYVFYCMKYVNNLLANGIKPIMIFDGCHLPSKREVEKTRRERRETYRKKAAQFLREGKRSEARDCLTKCIDITSQMALELMNACRAKGVDCIVAPYEADAQLAYLNKRGIAQVIITEDSDLVLFGCEKVMFKMDFAGNGILIEQDKLNLAMDIRPDCFTVEKFRYMCILSGCDYLASLYGIGLGKACKLFKLTRQMDMNVVLKKMPTTLKMPSLTVTPDYIEGFHKANNTFLYQLVFDPLDRKLKPLNPYPDDINPADLTYAGPPISEEKALQIAYGNIDINTGERIADFDPDTYVRQSNNWSDNSKPFSQGKHESLHMLSVWDRNYRPMPKFSYKEKVERATTCGKEVKVQAPVIKRSSSVKRLREEDVEHISDKDLVSMYNSTAAEESAELLKEKEKLTSHPEKKMKIEDVMDLIDIDFSSSDHWSGQDHILQENVSHDSESPKKNQLSPAKKKSPKKRSDEEENVQPGTENEEKEQVKRKNVFAVQKLKKEKFDINSPKIKVEVRSRYFANSSASPVSMASSQKVDFFSSLSDSHSKVDNSKPTQRQQQQQKSLEVKEDSQENDQADWDSETPDKTTDIDDSTPAITSKHQSGGGFSDSASRKGSPFSSFSWKSNLDKFRIKKAETISTVTLKSNENVMNQFKPVKPVSSSQDIPSQSVLSDESYTDNPDYTLEDIPVLPSQCSDVYSIDGEHSFSFSQSSGLSELNRGSQRSVSRGSPECGVGDVIDLSFEDDANENLPESQTTNENTPKLPSLPKVTPERKLLGSCRRSGLSKSKKKSIPTTGSQQSISNFFNKFKNDKRAVEKVEPIVL